MPQDAIGRAARCCRLLGGVTSTDSANASVVDVRPGFWRTWMNVTFRPAETFATPPERRSRWSPVLFGALTYAIAMAGTQAGSALLEGKTLGEAMVAGAGGAIAAPLLFAPELFVSATLSHALMMLLRARSRPFGDTLRCLAQCSAPLALSVLPLVGWFVGPIWSLACAVIGLAVVHQTARWRAAAALLTPITVAVAILVVVQAFVLDVFRIPASSMFPTLAIGDQLLVSKLSREPKRGDVIVFRGTDDRERAFIKRVVGMPGDTVTMIAGVPVINGRTVTSCEVGKLPMRARAEGDPEQEGLLVVEMIGGRRYLVLQELAAAEGGQKRCADERGCGEGEACARGVCARIEGPWEVAAGEYFVLGDNRGSSFDSRMWNAGHGGGLPGGNIIGKALRVFLSLSADGAINWWRVWLDAQSEVRLPPGAGPELAAGLQKCLQQAVPQEP